MAHYTVVANDEKDNKTIWKACAIMQASCLEHAGYQARVLRKNGGLSFVAKPSRFRVRRATRGEIQLLSAFFQSFGPQHDEEMNDDDAAALFGRRRHLIRSFFMGIYIDIEAMRRRYITGNAPSPSGYGAPGSGGGTGGLAMGASFLSKEKTHGAEMLEQDFEDTQQEGGEGAESWGSDEGFVDESSQDAMLASILASSEANDGGRSRDEMLDLDIM